MCGCLFPFKEFGNVDHAEISVEPNVRHTFRVRVQPEGGQWSDWSDMKVSGEKHVVLLLVCFLWPLTGALYV